MSFDLMDHVGSEQKFLEKTIARYGNNPEHNFGYFYSHETKSEKCIFIRDGKYGIPATYNPVTKDWVMIGSPIAPKEEQSALLSNALSYLISKNKMKRFVAEFETEEKRQFVADASNSLKINNTSCILYWPVYEFQKWQGDKLAGKSWKKLRNLINRVKKGHDIEFIDAKNADKSAIKEMIGRWATLRDQTGFGINRRNSNSTDFDHYQRLVDIEFGSCTYATTALVDGKPSSVTVGWEIPNSDGAYYSGIGVYDLAIPYLGEYVNWYDLAMLKRAGYNEVDFGGSPKPLLMFKQKFKPSRIYRTHIFSIMPKV